MLRLQFTNPNFLLHFTNYNFIHENIMQFIISIEKLEKVEKIIWTIFYIRRMIIFILIIRYVYMSEQSTQIF